MDLRPANSHWPFRERQDARTCAILAGMIRRLGFPSAPLLAVACLALPVPLACFGNVELEACTFTDPTGCNDAASAASSSTGAAPGDDGVTTSGTTGGSVGTTGEGGSAGATTTTDDTGASSGTDTIGQPVDPPPTIADLVCDPEVADEVGPTVCTYTASADAVAADLLDDGQVIASGPASGSVIFPVTSGPNNNPGSVITVTVRDEAGQTASESLYQASTVKDPGTEKWTTIEPNDGAFSSAGAVALQGNFVIAAGVHYKNPLVIGTLRRYDQGGVWTPSDVGWSKSHGDWTKLAWLKSGNFGPTGLAVDADQNIILVGIGFENGEPRRYVARFHPDGALDWEVPGPVGTEARGVGVQSDGTIYVAGAKRTGVNPERWDMEVSVYGADKTAYGPIPYSDPGDMLNLRSERGRAVVVLKSGRVVILGTREIVDPNDPNNINKPITRGVALLFEGKGKRVGDDWTSTGDKLKYDAILAGVATDEGFATCGYAQEDPSMPGSKTQILIRWHGKDLQEIKAPRLETTQGAAVCNALGYNMEGATIVGAHVNVLGENDNQWIFAVRDAADLRVDYLKHNGASNGLDRVQALDCDYLCAWAGVESVDGAVQWITGLRR